MNNNFDNIPAELKAHNQWVMWKREEVDGKITKIPYQVNGNKAKSTDPKTWNSFEACTDALDSGKFSGIGFVITEDLGMIFIDWDKCRDHTTGQWKTGILEEIMSTQSYSEISQSGTGGHSICYGGKPGSKCKRNDREMYVKERFVVMTGDHIKGTPTTIQEAPKEAIQAIYDKMTGVTIPSTPNGQSLRSPDLTDEQVISMLMSSRLAQTFESLYDGILSEYGNDASVGDYHLCRLIAFYTQKPDQIERIARSSNLVRDKWNRADYVERTISSAMDSLASVYTGNTDTCTGPTYEEQKPIDWKSPLKQAVMDTQDADPETQIKAATDILRNVLATMPPIPRKETFLGKICPELKISNRAANDIYKKFEHDIHISSGVEWFNEKGKFVPSVMSNIIREKYNIITLTDTNDVWIYDPGAGFWKMGGDVFVKQFTQRALGLLSKKSLVEETLYHTMNETYGDRGVFNTEPDCINLKNGIYNLQKNTFSDHSPGGMFTFALPFNYNPDAECIKFDRFLEQCDVNKTLIYEIFAYCLVAGYPIQSFFIFLGDGGNGKGTTIRVLRKFLGEENITGHSMQAFDTNRYAKADLFGKLANICGDMPPKRVTDTSPIKNMSGGDAITAPVIYKGNITFENRAKPIFLLNHMPEFDDDTDSFDRRMVVQEFNNRVMGLDPDFNEADMWTDEELSGIFNHCLQVLPVLLQRGSFTGQMGIEETRIYRQRKGNIIQAFIDDCSYLSEYESVESTHVYTAFVKWCTEKHETVMTDKLFGRKLKESLPEIKRYRTGTGKDRKYMYKGLRLDDGYEELNLVEELDKYEKSKNNRIPTTKKTSLEETPSKPHQNPIETLSKKSDLSDTEATNEEKNPINSGYVVQKKNKSNKPGKCGGSGNCDTFIEKGKEGLMGLFSPKKAVDTEKTEIFDRVLIGFDRGLIGSILDLEEQTNKLIEDSLDQWEKFGGVIFSKNAHKAKHDIVGYHKMYGINPQLIYNAIDKRVNSRCVDCGNVDAPNRSESITGVTQHRCRDCYIEYQKLTPVKLPEVEVIS